MLTIEITPFLWYTVEKGVEIIINLPKRKNNRISWYDYSKSGAYFITICTKDKQNILGYIKSSSVGDDAHIVPILKLSDKGKVCEKYINSIADNKNIFVDKYVIMPNHIHMIISIKNTTFSADTSSEKCELEINQHRKSISKIIRSFKTLVSKGIGETIFQRSFHDHVIRNRDDYRNIWKYINNNPANWAKDCFYTE